MTALRTPGTVRATSVSRRRPTFRFQPGMAAMYASGGGHRHPPSRRFLRRLGMLPNVRCRIPTRCYDSVTRQMLHLHGQVASEVPLHRCSCVGIGVEYRPGCQPANALRGPDSPPPLRRRMGGRLGSAPSRRADPLPARDDMLVPRHPYRPTDNERHSVWNLAALNHPLPGFRRDPGSNAQDLQNLPRR